MLPKPLQVLWGNLTNEEIKKFGILAITYFFIIGTYWMMRVMKNEMFDVLVGYKKYQPMAKWASVIFVALSVLVYSKLVDMFRKDILFYVVLLFYGIVFVILAYLMGHSYLVTASPNSWIYSVPVLGSLVAMIPGKLLGWFSYVFLESFGSIVAALFWSFVASTTTTASAKRGYGMIISITQLGTIAGPTVVSWYAPTLGLPILFGVGGLIIAIIVPLLIKLYTEVIPSDDIQGPDITSAKKGTGFFEGLRLLFSHSYLMGILVVVTMYEVISTIVEYEMNTCALEVGMQMSKLNAMNGQAIGTLSLVFALLGTSFFMRTFGLRACLAAFPAMIGIILSVIYGMYVMGASTHQLMWAFFVGVVAFKGLSYALNNPSKEVLYIPTSKDVKFKAKGWIDAFGNRLAKASGAGVNAVLGRFAFTTLLSVGTFLSLGVVGFWMVVALYVGTAFNNLQRENKIIE